MQHYQDTAEQRAACFAKLMTFEKRQVLAYLQRDQNDKLSIIVQLWVAHTDEQLRVAITTEADDLTTIIFHSLNDESLPLMLGELGVPAMLAEIEDRTDG